MITARTITQDLAGQSFSVKNAVDGTEVKFEFPSSFDGWPRRGGEAIVFILGVIGAWIGVSSVLTKPSAEPAAE